MHIDFYATKDLMRGMSDQACTAAGGP